MPRWWDVQIRDHAHPRACAQHPSTPRNPARKLPWSWCRIALKQPMLLLTVRCLTWALLYLGDSASSFPKPHLGLLLLEHSFSASGRYLSFLSLGDFWYNMFSFPPESNGCVYVTCSHWIINAEHPAYKTGSVFAMEGLSDLISAHLKGGREQVYPLEVLKLASTLSPSPSLVWFPQIVRKRASYGTDQVGDKNEPSLRWELGKQILSWSRR